MNRLWDGYLIFHQPRVTRDGGLRCRYSCVGSWRTAPPNLLAYWIYIYISSTKGTLSERPMNDNLWMLCYGTTRAKISGDALAMKITCSGGDGYRCRTCGPARKLTRDVLANLRGTFGEASPMHRRLFGDASGNIRGLIGATSANSYRCIFRIGDGRWSFGDASPCNGNVLTISCRCFDDVMAMGYGTLLREGMGL